MGARFSAVILSGGASKRMGGSPKALLGIRGKTLLLHHLEWLRAAEECIVVTGSHHLEISTYLLSESTSEALDRLGPDLPRVVLNPNFEMGQFSSLQAGLSVLAVDSGPTFDTGGASAGLLPVVVLPVDVPPLEGLELDELVEATRFPGIRVAIPQHKGRDGHPVVLSPEAVFNLLDRPVGYNLRDYIHEQNDAVVRVPTTVGTVLQDLDTREDVLSLRLKTD